MYENVLLPVDGDTGASELLHHASEIAHWTDGEIRLLFVADTGRDSVTVVEQEVVDALESEGEQIVEEAAKTLDTLGVDYETDVVQGSPAPTIAEYAERYDHDLIAMPTHGRAGLSRRLLGSVTEKVVQLSSVPVLTARMAPDEEFTFPYEGVLVPTDGSPTAMRAARHALGLADALDATVHALSVVDDPSLGFDVRSAFSESELESVATDAVEDVASAAEEYGDLDVVTHVAHGEPHEEIEAYVEGNEVDAVVMGTTGRQGVDRILLGSVAAKTVRSAPVPVITVGGSR